MKRDWFSGSLGTGRPREKLESRRNNVAEDISGGKRKEKEKEKTQGTCK